MRQVCRGGREGEVRRGGRGIGGEARGKKGGRGLRGGGGEAREGRRKRTKRKKRRRKRRRRSKVREMMRKSTKRKGRKDHSYPSLGVTIMYWWLQHACLCVCDMWLLKTSPSVSSGTRDRSTVLGTSCLKRGAGSGGGGEGQDVELCQDVTSL